MKTAFTENMKGRVCLISGATSGVGRAIAEGLLRRKATVVLLSRDRQRAKKVARRLSARAPHARTEVMEWADESTLGRLWRLSSTLTGMSE